MKKNQQCLNDILLAQGHLVEGQNAVFVEILVNAESALRMGHSASDVLAALQRPMPYLLTPFSAVYSEACYNDAKRKTLQVAQNLLDVIADEQMSDEVARVTVQRAMYSVLVDKGAARLLAAIAQLENRPAPSTPAKASPTTAPPVDLENDPTLN